MVSFSITVSNCTCFGKAGVKGIWFRFGFFPVCLGGVGSSARWLVSFSLGGTCQVHVQETPEPLHFWLLLYLCAVFEAKVIFCPYSTFTLSSSRLSWPSSCPPKWRFPHRHFILTEAVFGIFNSYHTTPSKLFLLSVREFRWIVSLQGNIFNRGINLHLFFTHEAVTQEQWLMFSFA